MKALELGWVLLICGVFVLLYLALSRWTDITARMCWWLANKLNIFHF